VLKSIHADASIEDTVLEGEDMGIADNVGIAENGIFQLDYVVRLGSRSSCTQVEHETWRGADYVLGISADVVAEMLFIMDLHILVVWEEYRHAIHDSVSVNTVGTKQAVKQRQRGSSRRTLENIKELLFDHKTALEKFCIRADLC
jgi:hypothetical protein